MVTGVYCGEVGRLKSISVFFIMSVKKVELKKINSVKEKYWWITWGFRVFFEWRRDGGRRGLENVSMNFGFFVFCF